MKDTITNRFKELVTQGQQLVGQRVTDDFYVSSSEIPKYQAWLSSVKEEKGRSCRTCCTGRVFTDNGEGVGVFGGAGRTVPWGDRFCVTRIVAERHLSEEVRLRYKVG